MREKAGGLVLYEKKDKSIKGAFFSLGSESVTAFLFYVFH